MRGKRGLTWAARDPLIEKRDCYDWQSLFSFMYGERRIKCLEN